MRLRFLLSLLVLALVAAACSGGGDPEPTETPVAETTPTPELTAEPTKEPTLEPSEPATEDPGPVMPLPGRPMTDESLADLPVVAVKIDNDPDARPQVGLNAADVVIVEPIEGLTRLVAILHSTPAGEVGPVRSGRRIDPALFGAFNPIFTFSGAAGPNYPTIDAGFPDTVVNDRSQAGWRREGTRPAPHNLFIPLDTIRERHPDHEGPGDEGVFAFAEDQPEGGTDLDGFTVDYGRFRTVSGWTWDEGRGQWLRSQDGVPHAAGTAEREPGDTLSAANVVVLTVETTGSQVEPITVIGEGPAIVHRGGQAFEGVWRKATEADQFSFVTAAGEEIPLAPGPTWLEIHPDSGTYTVGAPDVAEEPTEG